VGSETTVDEAEQADLRLPFSERSRCYQWWLSRGGFL